MDFLPFRESTSADENRRSDPISGKPRNPRVPYRPKSAAPSGAAQTPPGGVAGGVFPQVRGLRACGRLRRSGHVSRLQLTFDRFSIRCSIRGPRRGTSARGMPCIGCAGCQVCLCRRVIGVVCGRRGVRRCWVVLGGRIVGMSSCRGGMWLVAGGVGLCVLGGCPSGVWCVGGMCRLW